MGVKRLVDWVRMAGHRGPLVPLSMSMVESWVALLGGKVNAVTIKTYLTTIHSWHIDMGYNGNSILTKLVQRVIRSIKRYHGTKATVQALPITLPIL